MLYRTETGDFQLPPDAEQSRYWWFMKRDAALTAIREQWDRQRRLEPGVERRSVERWCAASHAYEQIAKRYAEATLEQTLAPPDGELHQSEGEFARLRMEWTWWGSEQSRAQVDQQIAQALLALLGRQGRVPSPNPC